MKVAVIGVGHVGLVTCATLAHLGHEVAGIDVDADKIALLKSGHVPFYEPRLPELVAEGFEQGRLHFSDDPAEAIPGSEVVFICVGTPADAGGQANLAAVERSATAVARHASGTTVVVEKSTVPAGTAARVRETLRRERPDVAFHVVSNPEFLREGQAVVDSLEPDRILVGADDAEGLQTMRRLYEPLTDHGHRMIETDVVTAELSKHACNAFLALKISYANALARISELVGADVEAITDVMGTDPRIGPAFLKAGLGYGGYCFPKDVAAFQSFSSKLGYPFPLLSEIARINDEAIDAAVAMVQDLVWNLAHKRVGLLGLSFKPGTDDIRLSPALALARRLIALEAEVVGYDPTAGDEAGRELSSLIVARDPYAAAEGAHVLIVATAWEEFRALDLPRLRERMARPLIVDARNFLDPTEVAAAGFEYHALGRPSVAAGRPRTRA
jgi:UDPglucose 6-dehydrogenase